MRYVVARVINSPKGAVRTARLLITEVPEKTTIDNVLDALTSAGKAAEFSEAGVPFGNHEVKGDHRGWPFHISGIDDAPSMTWEKLTRVPTRNDGRRATLRFTEAEFATVTLAAQRAGKSLQQWALDAMIAAAEHQGDEAAPAPRVTKTTKRASVPLAPAEAAQ